MVSESTLGGAGNPTIHEVLGEVVQIKVLSSWEGVVGGLLGSWEWGFLLTGKLGTKISLTGNWESSIW